MLWLTKTLFFNLSTEYVGQNEGEKERSGSWREKGEEKKKNKNPFFM
jgi:hypothetical protein